MTVNTSMWVHVFMTAYLLFVTGCVAQKVYFDCGAKVDVVDVQGLILSPGFPYNYSSGTHCVWQFFVPVGYQLFLEIFDFDVFESDAPPYAAIADFEDEMADKEQTFTPAGSNENRSLAEESLPQSDELSKVPQFSPNDEVKQVVIQEQSTKMEITRVSNSAKRSADASSDLAPPHPPSQPLILGAKSPGGKAENAVSSPLLRGDLHPNPGLAAEESTPSPVTPNPAFPTDAYTVSPETQQSVVDACPHDVLYISDLIAFSSRFCGSNRPSSSQLVFGSSREMVEVIMELITTTHWGRGFALLFHYHNHTSQSRGAADRPAYTPTVSKVDSLLAAISGVAFCATVLTSALCVIFRPKLCPKRANSCSSSNSEVQEGVQNTGADGSELQLVTPNQPADLEVLEENHNNNVSLSLSLPHTGSSASADVDMSQNAELELSSNGLTELDLGTDEVFIISSAPSSSRLTLSAHTQKERFLRHSDTGPVRDWPSPDPTASPPGSRTAQEDGTASCARPRAWSVRTFQDFFPPLPQLHKKWCSWNSTSPFTKLVDSAPPSLMSDCRSEDDRKVFSDGHLEAKMADSNASDSSMSTASYPLTQPAQRQRRLNSASNLRRTRFTGPCFGLLSGPPEPAKTPGAPNLQALSTEPPSGWSGGQPQAEGDHISVPVFVISEEEDRQPLVLAEHLAPSSTTTSSMLNGLSRAVNDGKVPEVGSPNADPQSLAHSPLLLPRGRAEWRPWGSQASGGACHLPSDSHSATAADAKFSFVHNTASQTPLPSLSQSTVPCGVMGKEM